MKRHTRYIAEFCTRITLCSIAFVALTGFSGSFVTLVSGSVSSSVKFTFCESPGTPPVSMDIERFGVEKYTPGSGWVSVWQVSKLKKADAIIYGVEVGGKIIVPASPLVPNAMYRTFATATSTFGPRRYSNITFEILKSGDVVPRK